MTASRPVHNVIQRVAIFAPTPHDAQICKQILERVEIDVELCFDISQLCKAIEAGVGVGMVPDVHLSEPNLQQLQDVLQRQPEWSDFPLLVLLGKEELSSQRVDRLLSLGNVTLVPCPLRIAIFVSKLRARLRDRQRQCAVRDLLLERRRAADTVAIDSRRLRLALQAGQMGVWEWSERELYWSPRFYELFGFESTVIPAPEKCFERVHEEDRDELANRWHRSLTEGVDLEMEFRIFHPQLGQRWLSAFVEPLRPKSSKPRRNA